MITGEVTNWTLSDSVTRIVIPVGVAYGSSTPRVFENLLRAAQDSTLVMTDPAPSVLFDGFGPGALDFKLRFYIPNRNVFIDALNDVHTRIDDLFRQQGIEIAFPQLDLHLRSAEAAVGISMAKAKPDTDGD